MAQTADGPRKSEFIGIPLDRLTKRRLKAVAHTKGQKHTELARAYIAAGIERDERQPTGASK